MGNILFIFAFMTLSFSFFCVSTSINAVNRAVLYIPIEIFLKNVNVINVDSKDDLYFYKNSLTNDLDSYFEESLNRYVISYEATYIFTNGDNSMVCLFDRCQGISITIDASICFNATYSKTMFYSIGES